jgi:three-Cys-motif partner protein
MTTPDTFDQTKQPYSAVRYQLVQRYLQFWIPKLLDGGADFVTFAQGFANAGHDRTQPGLPLLAYREAGRETSERDGKRVKFVLLEEGGDDLDLLREDLGEAGDPDPALPVTIEGGADAERLIDTLEAAGSLAGPIFAYLENPAESMTPFELISRIGENKASEVLLAFAPRCLNAFATGEASGTAAHRIFGGTHWKGVFSQLGSAKYTYLISQYRASLAIAGFKHTLSLEILDPQGTDLYVTFATNKLAHLKAFKRIVWTLDRTGDARYRDPRDPNQEPLAIQQDPADGPLLRQLLMFLRNHPDGVSIERLRDFTVHETIYRQRHADRAIRTLVDQGLMENTVPGKLSAAVIMRPADHDQPQHT